MTVQQLIDSAKSSELKQLALKDDNSDIISFMNLGLIELYKKFQLKTDEAIIALQDGKSIYSLDGTDPDVSMGDTDYMWMIAAYGEVSTQDSKTTVAVLPINTEDDPLSINTINVNQIEVPATTDGAYISIIYIASPRWLTTADLDNKVPVPPQLIEALLEYIGYRGHKSVDTERAEAYYQKFEVSCNEVQIKGMVTSDDLSMKDRISKRGFV